MKTHSRHILTVFEFPGNRIHDLCAANTMLYQLSYRSQCMCITCGAIYSESILLKGTAAVGVMTYIPANTMIEMYIRFLWSRFPKSYIPPPVSLCNNPHFSSKQYWGVSETAKTKYYDYSGTSPIPIGTVWVQTESPLRMPCMTVSSISSKWSHTEEHILLCSSHPLFTLQITSTAVCLMLCVCVLEYKST